MNPKRTIQPKRHHGTVLRQLTGFVTVLVTAALTVPASGPPAAAPPLLTLPLDRRPEWLRGTTSTGSVR